MGSIKNRGFASMSKARRVEIAQLGGKKAHILGKAHQYSREEAVKAGRIGGKNRIKNLNAKRTN